MRRCKKCKKVITGRKDKMFCNNTCQTRYNSRKYYQKHKSDPEFKLKRQNLLNKWISKHRERFNELCRENNKLQSRRRRKLWRRLGLCVSCGRKIDRENRLTCSRHYVPIKQK